VTYVRGVFTQQGTDISELINQTAGDWADSYTGVLIAESNLNEFAFRDGTWPDYSAGLSQVIAANLGYGTYQQRPSESQLALYREYMFVPLNAIRQGWRYYLAALNRMNFDPLWAALSYNRGPSYTRIQLEDQVEDIPAIALRFERYRQSLQKAEGYRVMSLSVGQGLRDRMTSQSDQPVTDEYTLRVNSDGTTVQAALGTKGLYIWHPTTGSHGPLPVTG
jgi:hypothetical protein